MRVPVLIAALFLIIFAAPAQSAKLAKLKQAEVLGDTLLNQQDFAGALKQYNKVAKGTKLKDAPSRQILYKRAVCYFYLGEFDNALADLDVFIPENPNTPRARILRAFIYREMDNPEGQLADLDEILQWDTNNLDVMKWRAGVLVELERNREAITQLQSVRIWGSDEEVELYLGIAYYGLNESDSALVHFNEAISINGGYLPAYMYAGSLLLEGGSYDQALLYLDLANRLEPGNMQVVFYKGVALVELNRKDEGCRLLNRAFYSGIDDAAGYLQEHCFIKE